MLTVIFDYDNFFCVYTGALIKQLNTLKVPIYIALTLAKKVQG